MFEFIEETHTYLLNGKKLPSVSTILGDTIFSDKYAGVDEYILRRAAQFGTNVHKAIELEMTFMLNDEELEVYKKWLFLKERKGIEPYKKENKVHLDELYAGTYDMEAMINGEKCLCDIKTTYELDLEYISWQLSLYELASGKRFDKLYAIWTPKRQSAELREVKRRTQTELEALLTMYYGEEIDLSEYYGKINSN